MLQTISNTIVDNIGKAVISFIVDECQKHCDTQIDTSALSVSISMGVLCSLITDALYLLPVDPQLFVKVNLDNLSSMLYSGVEALRPRTESDVVH